jgi:hypothetical protein
VHKKATTKLIHYLGEHIDDIELKGGALDFGKLARLVCQHPKASTKKF